MKKFFFSYIFFFIFLIFFLIIVYTSLDSSFRRKIIGLSLGLVNNYYSITIQDILYASEPNIIEAIKKIEQQIEISDFLTTKSKNSFLDNVYFNAHRVENFINKEGDYKYFSRVIEKLIEKDPNIYSAIVWHAKLMHLNNFKKEKIIDKINQAIDLSPANLEAYKFALDYSFETNQKDLFDQYCSKYHLSVLGGDDIKNVPSFFGSNSLSKFVIQIEPTKAEEEFYIMEGLILNTDSDYTFTLHEPRDLNGLNLVANFFPGTSINLVKIEISDTDNKIIELPLNKTYLNSKNSFFQLDRGQIKLIVASKNDDKIKIKFDKVYKNITKMKIKLNFSRLNLTNQPSC